MIATLKELKEASTRMTVRIATSEGEYHSTPEVGIFFVVNDDSLSSSPRSVPQSLS